ncbi:efflux RND transporter permease subunit [Sulfitobacter sp. D35]|uniref:efflux RND transporter permease subunit n=1 Tax=Sulfitobacter sp. D35 TaxID=3083252 RepID=UPI00296FD066|nr:efflux RND transporter permease subunit [Sulfitobacter sp. D35]MDW4496970.1 efflux RND transporter permease subunit [Sulfitobacter sp. D35]
METLTFRQPRLVALALLVIIAAGVSSLLAIGRQEDPTITNLFGTVTTVFPGADPRRVESLVTSEIEDVLRQIPEVDVIESVSATGISVVTVELGATVPDDAIEGIWSEIRDDLADVAATFPADVQEPDFDTDNGAFAAILALRAADPATPLTLLGRYAEDIAQKLRNISGTEQVEIYGAPEEEVLVTLDPERSAALGLSAGDVSRAVAAADSRGQAGRLRGDAGDYLVNVEGEVDALDRLREVILREGADGSVTRLDQVAKVTRGPRLPSSELALVDGTPAVLVAAKLESGRQVDVWAGQVRDEIATYRADLPEGLALDQIFDQSAYTAERLAEVGLNMAIGVALVVAVLLVTLGLRSAMIVALILPVVTLATLFTMNLIGLPIHQMSVTGLIVALGLLVDAAIVMTDEVGQRLAAGLSRRRAVSEAVRRLFAPLLASTVTTALSFTPLILLPGAPGDFVGAIAIAVVTMLWWSFVIAITLTPAIAGWFLPDGAGARRGEGLPGRLFARSILWAVENPVKSVALSLVLPVTGFLSLPTLTAQFFPGVDRDQFTLEVDMAPGTAIAATRDSVDRLDAALRGDARVTSVTWLIGRSAPPFYYNVIGNREDAPGHAHALVTTSSPDATESLLFELERDLAHAAPEAQVLVRGLVQGPPVAAPVEVRIVGDNLETLRELGDAARTVMAQVDAISVARSTIGAGAPKLAVAVDEAQAQRLGLDLGGIARQLNAGLEGVTGGALVEGTEQIPVRVRLGDDVRGDLQRVRDLPILPPDAAALSAEGRWPALPLSAIATVDLVPAASSITRRNSERVNSVQGFVQRAVLPEEALAQVRAALDAEGFALPRGYRLEIGGDSDARNDTLNDLFASLGLIVTLSIAAIALTFNSFRLTGVALVVCGLAAGLSLLALAIFQYPFGITAIIGVIGSIGVSINAAIIILTGLKADSAARQGDRSAMAAVVGRSARHIVSTTITTFGGFLPLILAGGGFWPPFAMAVAGGVLLSTVVSFYFTPPMFALVYARRPERREILTLRESDRIYPLDLRPAAE